MVGGAQRRSSPQALRRTLRSLAVDPALTPARVHRLHRALRKHRLRAEGGVAPSPRTDRPYPPVLRSVERSLGQLRDLTLFRATLGRAAPRGPSRIERAWRDEVLRRVRAREATLRGQVRRLAARALPALTTGSGRRFASEREPPRRFPEVLDRALRRLSAGRAHALRKELRRHLLAAPGTRPGVKGEPGGLVRRLVRELGRLHDLDVALERIDDGPRAGGKRWRDHVARERRDLARQLRRRLRSRATARTVQSLRP